MKKGKKFNPQAEKEFDPNYKPKKKKKVKFGPKKQHFSKYSIDTYYEEE